MEEDLEQLEQRQNNFFEIKSSFQNNKNQKQSSYKSSEDIKNNDEQADDLNFNALLGSNEEQPLSKQLS